jgi:hypothetical protein
VLPTRLSTPKPPSVDSASQSTPTTTLLVAAALLALTVTPCYAAALLALLLLLTTPPLASPSLLLTVKPDPKQSLTADGVLTAPEGWTRLALTSGQLRNAQNDNP